MTPDSALASVRRALNGRRLLWWGSRGEDAEPLLRVPEFAGSFAIIAPLRAPGLAPGRDVTLESLTGIRPDLERYDIDFDPGEPAAELRRRLLREVNERCVVATYRPSALVSALAFAMSDTMALAGMFHIRQRAFEHKPWVESSLATRGINGIAWRYLADEQRADAKRMVAGGPVVLRSSRNSGGVGIALAHDGREIDEYWPSDTDQFVAVAPFRENAVPVNFSGCVYTSGDLRLQPPSVQLIGIRSCTDRPLGHCGNDFARIGELDDETLERLESLALALGSWLADERYLGAFGADALVQDGEVFFIEINARFQGSSTLSAELATDLEAPDLFIEHLAATLGLEPVSEPVSLREWAKRQGPASHVIIRNTENAPARHDPDAELPRSLRDSRVSQLADDLPVEPGGTLARLTFRRGVTDTGFQLDEGADAEVAAVRRAFSLPVAANPVTRIDDHG